MPQGRLPGWEAATPQPRTDGQTHSLGSAARREDSALSGLGQTGWGAGWVRGLKACCGGDVSLPPPRPLPPSLLEETAPSPPRPPSDSQRLHIWGKTPSWSILPGGEHSPRAWEMERRAGLGLGNQRERPFMDRTTEASPRDGRADRLIRLHCAVQGGGTSGGRGKGPGEREAHP